ncbi:MAG: EamA family transporter [Alphaproteobacteria bacterium]|jgi:drug/metabolite transporter (DMT)-like permease|nr:EamA family transporter [Alphaproteobacteria bacterium]MBT5389409.1 EamA family transporter [Alphaproteobacteria bacterium]MBT5541055.1 EamA family transporter [Alphaproteobacteria bacterium]MBT5655103.1 EamA family transporter [Alphaproteobacteria bacterium]
MNYLPLILSGVFLNALAQLLLKQGMLRIGHFEFVAVNILPVGIKVAKSPFIVGGIACYVLSVVIWILALARVEVSYAYPLLSVGYIFTAIAAYYFLGENLSWIRVFGIFTIMLGVYCVART